MSNDIKLSLEYEQLKKVLKELEGKSDHISLTINVEKVDIHIKSPWELPVNFNFEKVDVKENKGNINFGNNFGVKGDNKKEKEHPPSKDSIHLEEEDISIIVNNKRLNYY